MKDNIFFYFFMFNSIICLNLREKTLINNIPVERSKIKYQRFNKNNLKYIINRTLILIFVIICYIIKKIKSGKEKEEKEQEYRPLKKKFKKNKYYDMIPTIQIKEENIIVEKTNDIYPKTNKIYQEYKI